MLSCLLCLVFLISFDSFVASSFEVYLSFVVFDLFDCFVASSFEVFLCFVIFVLLGSFVVFLCCLYF